MNGFGGSLSRYKEEVGLRAGFPSPAPLYLLETPAITI
jgi:hypothetical protein